MDGQLTGTQDLRTYLRILWRWKLVFAAIVILIPLAVYLAERGKPNVYESSTLIELQNVSVGVGATSAPVVTGNINAVARLVTTTPVARLAARHLHPPPANPAALLGDVSASADQTTGFVTITAEAGSPHGAAAIANAFAAALSAHQSQQAIDQIDQQISGDRTQLANTPASDRTDRSSLTQQIAQLEGLKGTSSSGAQVIQAATPDSTPVGPRLRRTIELALLIAILLGIGGVILAENADRRLRTPDDLESLTQWPLLGVIPPSTFVGDILPAGREQEAFQMLNASLGLFNVDEPVSSMAVISPLVADGKTTVALGLAQAAARAGQDVILVDADLRRPQIGSRLGIGATSGLVTALTGEEKLEDLLVTCDVETPEGARLRVLPAGPPAPNPVAIVSSPKLRTLIERLESMADLVIVDTAAALAVSDSLPLLRTVSGVVVVVRMNRSVGGGIRRLQKVLSSARIKVLGTVATGSESVVEGYGDHGYYYYERTTPGAPVRRLRRRRSHAAPIMLVPSGNGHGNKEERELVAAAVAAPVGESKPQSTGASPDGSGPPSKRRRGRAARRPSRP